MSANDSRAYESGPTTDAEYSSMADDLASQIANSFTVGTDEDGYTHHYYAPADTVVVYDDTGVDTYQHLDGDTLETWVEFIEQERGWRSMGQFAALGIDRDAERKEGH